MLKPENKTLEAYLNELEKSKEGRPEQVKNGLEAYVELWKKAIGKGLVSPDETVESALAKVEDAGGLYQAAEGD